MPVLASSGSRPIRSLSSPRRVRISRRYRAMFGSSATPSTGAGRFRGSAGMSALPDSVKLIYATATDAPFLEPRWITRLSELISGYDVAIPLVESEYHPLASLYRRAAVLPALKSMLSEDRLKLKEIVELVRRRGPSGPEELQLVDRELRTLRNLNTPEDYERALGEA